MGTDLAAVAANSSCGNASSWGGCSVENTGSQIDLSGSKQHTGNSGNGGDSNGDGGSDAIEQETDGDSEECTDGCLPGRPNYGVQVITLEDLASFVPAKPHLSGEPAGIGIVGMPTNLLAGASAQDVEGTLFDAAVTVRFTPAGYRFSYGDGTARTTNSGGATWSALGQADFTPTSTSHVYAERGTYSAAVTVLYSAAVSFGDGWVTVPGVVEATTSGYDIRVVEVHTALVDRTCLENPRGPGC